MPITPLCQVFLNNTVDLAARNTSLPSIMAMASSVISEVELFAYFVFEVHLFGQVVAASSVSAMSRSTAVRA